MQLCGIQRIYLISFFSRSHVSELDEFETDLLAFHDLNYVNVRKRSTGCAGTLHVGDQNQGKYGGQIIRLGPDCMDKGTVIHEFIHAFGFFHEHVRADRDKYIKLNLEKIGNMTLGEQHQYALQNNSITYGLPYDGGSIMHYHSSSGADFISLVKIVSNT